MEVNIDLRKTIEQNAAVYFEKAKKLRKKIAGIKATIEKAEKKLGQLEKQSEEVKREKPAKRKPNWYEKFRWFISSDGFLVIGGRDSTTNEIVIKKHTEPNDLILHTDMAGSPFFVIQAEGKTIPESTIKEAANATCTFSKAWKLGMSSQQVFCVKPEQVSKQANPGEYLVKGAFMIRGKTNYIDNDIDCAVGITDDGAVMAAPEFAVKKHCKKYIKIQQGNEKISEIAKRIRAKIGGDLDAIIRAMPSGGAKISSA